MNLVRKCRIKITFIVSQTSNDNNKKPSQPFQSCACWGCLVLLMASQPASPPGKWCCCYSVTCLASSSKGKTSLHDPAASLRKGKSMKKRREARGMEYRVPGNSTSLQDFCKQQPVMATARERKTDMEGNVFTTAAGAGGRGRDSPALRSSLSTPVGPQGWAGLWLPTPIPAFLGGPSCLWGGYSSSALVIASLILLLHPCGMPTDWQVP